MLYWELEKNVYSHMGMLPTTRYVPVREHGSVHISLWFSQWSNNTKFQVNSFYTMQAFFCAWNCEKQSLPTIGMQSGLTLQAHNTSVFLANSTSALIAWYPNMITPIILHSNRQRSMWSTTKLTAFIIWSPNCVRFLLSASYSGLIFATLFPCSRCRLSATWK